MKYSSATHALSVNPATGETLGAFAWATPEEVERAIYQSDAGYRQWRRESVSHRAQKLRDLGAAPTADGLHCPRQAEEQPQKHEHHDSSIGHGSTSAHRHRAHSSGRKH